MELTKKKMILGISSLKAVILQEFDFLFFIYIICIRYISNLQIKINLAILYKLFLNILFRI